MTNRFLEVVRVDRCSHFLQRILYFSKIFTFLGEEFPYFDLVINTCSKSMLDLF